MKPIGKSINKDKKRIAKELLWVLTDYCYCYCEGSCVLCLFTVVIQVIQVNVCYVPHVIHTVTLRDRRDPSAQLQTGSWVLGMGPGTVVAHCP